MTLISPYRSTLPHKYKTGSKRTWQVMKEITGKQKTKSSISPTPPPPLLQEIQVDKTIIAKEFNKFFTSVGPKLSKNPKH